MTFDELERKWSWRPIRNCPGRYVLVDVPSDLPLEAFVGNETKPLEFDVEAARDRILATPVNGGGIISYKRNDGSYLHTLNDSEGFARKLRQLGITLQRPG